MRKPLFVRPLTDAERAGLQAGLRSSDAFLLRRCQILLASSTGLHAQQIADQLHCDEETVRRAIKAFNIRGLTALTPGSSWPRRTRDHLSDATPPCNRAAADLNDAMPDRQAAGGATKCTAVAALCEGEAKYRMLIEHIPAITYIAAWDAESSTLYTSLQIESMLGFARDEWMSDPTRWLNQIHPEDRAFVLDELARLRTGGTPRPCEYRMITRDGRVRWFRDEVAILWDEDGRPCYLYGVMLDITERVQLEVGLEHAQQQLAKAQQTRRLELAQELEDALVCHLTALHNRLRQIQRAASDIAEVHRPTFAAIITELDVTAQQVLGVIATLCERTAGLHVAQCAAPHLTLRELAILRLLALGKNNREIAQGLGISVKTVEKHVGKLYAKLGVHSRAEAVVWAAHEGLIENFKKR